MNANLNYEGYENYLLRRDHFNKYGYEWVQYIFKFDNHYGASVIKGYSSYGYYEDLWELAVIEFVDKYEWELCYLTEITCNDVAGYLTNDEVLVERFVTLCNDSCIDQIRLMYESLRSVTIWHEKKG